MSAKDTYLKQQAKKLTEGHINRRRFVMSALATGVTLPTAMSLATKAEAMTPKAGGVLRYGLGFGSTTDSMDPSTSENHMSLVNIYTRGNHLMEIAPDGTLQPELAESLEASADAKTWVFNLRKGV